jgi:carbamoyltransferase
MIVLGVSGSFDRVDELAYSQSPVHDASAALVEDGVIVAATEEERFNRCKHSGKLPIESIRYCLATARVGICDIDHFVFNVPEAGVDQSLELSYRAGDMCSLWSGRLYVQHLLDREFRQKVDPSRFEFIDHHYAHAASAFLPSGYDDSLVVTLDGMGSGLSGTVWTGANGQLAHIKNYDGYANDTTQSLGHLYLAVTIYLGFRTFDEYKVMGLAPYGDRGRLREVFKQLYKLRDEGEYEIYLSRLNVLQEICPQRRPRDPVEQVHQDVAASLQELLETVAFHVLEHHRNKTGQRRLCLAGGVAQNCALNGKILQEGLFEEAFVQPAAHDGGLSLGGALHGYRTRANGACCRVLPMRNAYLGMPIGDDAEIERELSRWDAFLDFERHEDIAEKTGQFVAEGLIVGWVQGRAEFGPRALGNRSIVADPRPAENKDIINAMIKKREAFRPFAPSVLEECAAEYFELPQNEIRLPFMVFVVKVRKEHRECLGAITHVDGTARIQTVSRNDNELYWALINAFGRRTGIPIVLNTSFNNNAEPIVNSARDAIACYLTTGLHRLVLGKYAVERRKAEQSQFAELKVTLGSDATLHRRALKPPDPSSDRPDEGKLYKVLFNSLNDHDEDREYFIGNTHDFRKVEVSEHMAAILARADGFQSLSQLARQAGISELDPVVEEALTLWGRRVIRLEPGDE